MLLTVAVVPINVSKALDSRLSVERADVPRRNGLRGDENRFRTNFNAVSTDIADSLWNDRLEICPVWVKQRR